MRKLTAAALLAATLASAQVAQAQTRDERAAEAQERKEKGSLYLRCDGEPNNMTGGESFARFLGAITLLALFAPAPETPDPSKRLFGAEGVDACTQLIDGDKAEGNAVRRVPLILARSLHRIEAKEYEAALADVVKAREEAAAAGLVGNPYFDRSMGLSFAKIEAEILLRKKDPAAARDVALAAVDGMAFSFVPSIVVPDYASFVPDLSPAAERKLAANARIFPALLFAYADKLEEVGRFADAAAKREALIAVNEGLKPDDASSVIYARTALSHALAGSWDEAEKRAEFARSNLAARRAAGKPETNGAQVVEVLDLYDIARLAHQGDLATARRNFAARSQWLEPSLGTVMAVNRRLREGASEADLFGALATTPEDLWQKRFDDLMAVRLQRDTDNKTLFALIQPYAKVDDFENRTKDTWRVTKSRMMAKEADEDGQWRITSGGNIYSGIDSIMLHAALQAQAQGKDGFTMLVVLPQATGAYMPFSAGFARFVDRAEVASADALFIPASEVVAELSPVIPSPTELDARRKARR